MGSVMGRERFMGQTPSPESRADHSADILNETFEAALRGDAEALRVLVSLLKTRYGDLIMSRLWHRPRGAQHATLEDVFQESLVGFIEEIKSGALAELPESERRNIVGYFQNLCDSNLRQRKRSHEDPIHQKKDPIPYELTQDKRVGAKSSVPGEDRKTEEHRILLHQEMARLDPFDRLVLERHLAKVPYSEIAKETGKKVPTLESLVTRIKQRLGDRIRQVSETAQIHEERARTPKVTKSCLPGRQEILAAVDELPIETQQAVLFVHVNGGTVEDLARTLGDRGREKAEARLKRGYETLSIHLNLPFPESFDGLEK